MSSWISSPEEENLEIQQLIQNYIFLLQNIYIKFVLEIRF